MNDELKVIATLMIEPDLEQYNTFFDRPCAEALFKRAPAALDAAVSNLCLSWRMAANTHRLPWLMIHQLEGFAGGIIRRSKPDLTVLIGQFRDWILRELDGELKRTEKKVINAVIKKIDQRLRLASQAKNPRIPAMEYWDEISNQQEMAFSITGSQNLSYCALIFAYEWFLVGCFRALGGEVKLKSNQPKFWKRFEELFGRDPVPDYWEEPEGSAPRPILVARIARHSIAHTGGIAKEELKAEKHDLVISPEGFISVRPSNNRALFNILKGKVDRLVDEVAPKLLTTVGAVGRVKA
jgi:hypothetical protein